ncbi:MAG: flagellar hook-length control protein FliK [Pseudomonadales bacterium]
MSEQSLAGVVGAQLLAAASAAAAGGADAATRRGAGGDPLPAVPEAHTPAFAGMLEALRGTEPVVRTAVSGSVLRIEPTLPVPEEIRFPLLPTDTVSDTGKRLPVSGKVPLDAGMLAPPPVLAEGAAGTGPAVGPETGIGRESIPEDSGEGEPTASLVQVALPAPPQLSLPGADANVVQTRQTAMPPAVAAPAPPPVPGVAPPVTPAPTAADPVGAPPAPPAASLAGQTLDGGNGNGQPPAEQSGREPGTRAVADGGRHGASIGFDRVDLPASATSQGPAFSPPGAATGTGTAESLRLLDLPAQKTHWPEPLAERLAALVGRGGTPGINTADVRLNPTHLGRLEVRITVHHDQASVWVASASPEVRDALQQALPRLDSLLDNLGIRLADAQVSDRSFEGFFRQPQAGAAAGQSPDAEPADPAGARPVVRLGLLDYWA